MDPIAFRGIERLLIIFAAIAFVYLGYRLFEKGIRDDQSKVSFQSKLMKLIVSGRGPGLFFMSFGAVILVAALMTGGATITESAKPTTSENTPPVGRQWSLMSFDEKYSLLESCQIGVADCWQAVKGKVSNLWK